MNRHEQIARAQRSAFFSLFALTAAGGLAFGQQSITYTTDADFDLGVSSHVNHTAVHDQLQLDVNAGFHQPFVCLAMSGNGTMVRFDANTGAFFGEYATAPNGKATNPSRIDIDSKGNAWIANRDEASNVGITPKGSIAKIGIVLGGTRSNADGSANPNGEYVKGPFAYNTCVDRNNDGLIHTSRGLSDVLAWPNITDGDGGVDGIVQDAQDECILIYQRTDSVANRHVSVDPTDDVWVGGYPNFPFKFNRLDENTGAILKTLTPRCGGHGGDLSQAGILWSTSQNENSVMRYDTLTDTILPCVPTLHPHGLTIDNNGFIWVAQFDLDLVSKFSPAGILEPGFPVPSGGAAFDRSLAVTADNDIWICSGAGNDFVPGVDAIARLANNGTIRKVIQLGANGLSPRGVSVDSNGKLWVGNFASNNAMRIDPNGDADGLGAVDMTLNLGTLVNPNPAPYNISNFTGEVDASATQPDGSWTVTYDAGAPNIEFGTISYSSFEPPSTSLNAEFRAANTIPALNVQPFQPVVNGVPFSGVFGQFIQVRVNFLRANPTITASPVLFDLTIQSLNGPPPCVASGSAYPGSLLVFPEFDNRVGDMTILTVTDTAAFGSNVDVEFVYIGRVGAQNQLLNCLEANRTEHLTPNDTLSLITKFHNPNQNQGYVYAFAKDKTTHQAIVHNSLIGNELMINGIQVLSYSNNPFVFPGIGAEGTPTDHDGDGIRDLNNLEYGCAPDQLLVPRFLGQVGIPGVPPAVAPLQSDLILINLTGGPAFTATIDFLIYNDNEEGFSAQTSFQCWVKRALHDVTAVFDNDFLLTTNHSLTETIGIETGWFRMDGNVANSTAASFADPAFLAVLVETTGNRSVSDLPFELGTQLNGDLLAHGIFGDLSP